MILVRGKQNKPQSHISDHLVRSECAKHGTKRVYFSKVYLFKQVQMWDLHVLFNVFFSITNPTLSILHVFHTSFIVLNIIKAKRRVSD